MSDSSASAPLSTLQFRAARWIPGILALVLTVVLVWKRAWLTEYRELLQNTAPTLKEIVPATVWPGLLGAAVLLAGLALTARWWARAWPAARPAVESKAPRWFVITLLLLTVAGAAVRAPRLGLSLYNDEAHVFRLHLGGAIPRQFTGQPDKFKEAKWFSTFYENRAGNNSMPFSVLSRGSYDLWRKMTGAAPGTINETALRLPVMIGGVLSILAMGWLGFRLGGVRTGAAAALLTAFHPWHVRYSVEARCYGILMLLIPLLFLALHRALRTGSWRAWLGFGLLQYLTVACFLGASHFVLALNLALFGISVWPALKHRSWRAVSWPLLVPAAVAGALSAALYLAVNFPLFWQTSKFMEKSTLLHGSFTAEWFHNAGALLTFGVPAAEYDPSNPLLQSMARFWGQTPSLTLLTAAVILVSLAAGVWRMLRAGGAGALLVLACFGGAALTLGYCRLKGLILLQWYSIFLLPGTLFLLASGFVWLSAEARERFRLPLWIFGIPLGVFWADALGVYLDHSRENFRAAVEAARGAPYPASLQNPADSLFLNFWSECARYDHSVISPRTDGELDQWIEQARREKRPLMVEHGFIGQMRQSFPQTFARLNDPAEFEPVAVIYGLDDAQTTHRVYRLRPAARE